jgi:hypothetical protein
VDPVSIIETIVTLPVKIINVYLIFASSNADIVSRDCSL